MNFNITEIKSFVTENVTEDILKKIGITAGIFFVVIVSQLLIGAIVNVIDSIPVVNQLLMLIGLVSFIDFVRNNLVSDEKRQEFVTKVKNIYIEFVGEEV